MLKLLLNEDVDSPELDNLDDASKEIANEVQDVIGEVTIDNLLPNEAISKLIRDEREAIRSYARAIKSDLFSSDTKKKFQEIMNDESDHLLILTEELSRLSKEEFPEAGSED